MSEKIVELHDWYIEGAKNGLREYLANPNTKEPRLTGKPKGHPKHKDGIEIVTSAILGKVKATVVSKSGTRYLLKKCSHAYGLQYPAARIRLLTALPSHRPLKLFNGNGVGKYIKQHFYIAAYSKDDAARLICEVTDRPATNVASLTQYLRDYYSECWGNPMEGIRPERGIWAGINSDKPERLI